jgi:hypothetical protein
MPQPEQTQMTFNCSAGSSNPTSNVIWTLDGDDVTDQATETHPPGANNADSVQSVLTLTALRDMNGHDLKCGMKYGEEAVLDQDVGLNITCECGNLYISFSDTATGQ